MSNLRNGWKSKFPGMPIPKVTVTFKVTVTCVALDEESAKILKSIKGML